MYCVCNVGMEFSNQNSGHFILWNKTGNYIYLFIYRGWIPLCGPRLIKEGMNVFRRFGDLSPQQILLLFNQFSSWPEYKDSAFQAAAVRYYRKEVFSYEDDDDDD